MNNAIEALKRTVLEDPNVRPRTPRHNCSPTKIVVLGAPPLCVFAACLCDSMTAAPHAGVSLLPLVMRVTASAAPVRPSIRVTFTPNFAFIVSSSAQDASAWNDLGNAYCAKGEAAKAIDSFEKALRMSARAPPPACMPARELLLQAACVAARREGQR